MKRIAITAALSGIIAFCIYLLTRATQSQWILFLVIVACVVGIVRVQRKKEQDRPASKPQPSGVAVQEPVQSGVTVRSTEELSNTEPRFAKAPEPESLQPIKDTKEEESAPPVRRRHDLIPVKELNRDVEKSCPEVSAPLPTTPNKSKPTSSQQSMSPEGESVQTMDSSKETPAGPAEKPKSAHRLRLENALTKEVKLAGTAAVKTRQGYLRKISEGIEPFDFCTYGIEQTEYKGEPALKVYVDMQGQTSDMVIGMVPAEQVKSILQIYERIFEVDVDVYGGPEYDGDDKYYGASATFFYDPE